MERNTAQRQAIKQAFIANGQPMSPSEVLAAAGREVAGLGLATVYRTINALLEDGWLTAVEVPGDVNRYEIAGKDHHHHFTCNACERLFDVPGCAEALHHHVPAGFQIQGHDVMLYGLCDRCVGSKASRRRSSAARPPRKTVRPTRRR